MGTRKKFSATEQELLRANPYTEKVTENQISFTLAFKEAFWRLSVEGCTGNMALRKLGYDPELLGFERVHNITKPPEGFLERQRERNLIFRDLLRVRICTQKFLFRRAEFFPCSHSRLLLPAFSIPCFAPLWVISLSTSWGIV